MIGPVEALAVVLLLGCYGLAIGILQALGFVPLRVSQSFRFLGASGVGNIAGGLGALALGIAFPLGRRWTGRCCWASSRPAWGARTWPLPL